MKIAPVLLSASLLLGAAGAFAATGGGHAGGGGGHAAGASAGGGRAAHADAGGSSGLAPGSRLPQATTVRRSPARALRSEQTPAPVCPTTLDGMLRVAGTAACDAPVNKQR